MFSFVSLFRAYLKIKMQVVYLVLLLFYFQGTKVKVNSKVVAPKNLVFIYDVVNPGVNYQEFAEGVGNITKKLSQSESQIFDKFLVVFPFETSIEAHELDNTNYTSVLENIEKNFDLEDIKTNRSRILTGLWVGLYKCEPNSVIYVFTSATTPERSLLHPILCIIENKIIEINFVFRQNSNQEIPLEYQKISLHSNGVILIWKFRTIMNIIPALLITSKRKVNLLATNNDRKKQHTVHIDKHLDELIVVDWSTTCDACITNTYNYSTFSRKFSAPFTVRQFNNLKTNIISFKNLSTGDFHLNVTVNSSRFGLRIFGISDFDFDYYFCGDIRCTENFRKRPMLNITNFIRITSTNEKLQAVFKYCEVLTTDNLSVKNVTLKKDQSIEAYYGSFVPPSQPFYLRVTSEIRNEKVQRMSPVAITPIIIAAKIPFEMFTEDFEQLITKFRVL